jgi:RNA polymerase sigma-70 factor (ECF subfamily)
MIELARQPELPTDPISWLYQAVRFRAINLNRNERRREARERAAADQRQPYFTQNDVSEIDASDLESALKRLTVQNREIVIARIWGCLSFEQIAELTHLSSSTAHRHYRASLEELKKHLDKSRYSLPLNRNLS